MNLTFGTLSIVLGVAYIALGCLSIFEVVHDYHTRGISQFGIAFAAMAASCGPHHVIHGIHTIIGFDTNTLMAVSTVIGLPAGIVFVALRVEAMLGGRGDRFVRGTPAWLVGIAVAFLLGAGMLTSASISRITNGHHLTWSAFAPNMFVVITYSLVGVLLLRTQMRRRAELGGWSLSGLALSAIFPTCALMHLVYALSARGDVHIAPVDQLGIPASAYFLWVVYSLYREALVDWNRRPIVGPSRRADRPSPWDRRSVQPS
jgi:hypothetical protein